MSCQEDFRPRRPCTRPEGALPAPNSRFFVPSIWEAIPSFRSRDSQSPSNVSTPSTLSTDATSSPTTYLDSFVSPSSSRTSTPTPTSSTASRTGSSTIANATQSAFDTISSYLPSSLHLHLPKDPYLASAVSAVAAIGGTLIGMRVYRRHVKRIRNSDYVTSGMLDKGITVRGVVTSVGDGDNFRLFHTPLFYRLPLKLRNIPSTPKALKNETLHIRISGVDAPEAAHFGNPAQPHSAESLAWLRKTVLGKKMRVKLLRKDQYNRIVGVPFIRRTLLPDKPLPPMMLKEGMAVVYTAGGAEYGSWGLEKMQQIEDEARRNKRGLWALKKFEHPAEYKKRMKAAGGDAMVGAEGGSGEEVSGRSGGIWGLVRRIFGRA